MSNEGPDSFLNSKYRTIQYPPLICIVFSVDKNGKLSGKYIKIKDRTENKADLAKLREYSEKEAVSYPKIEKVLVRHIPLDLGLNTVD